MTITSPAGATTAPAVPTGLRKHSNGRNHWYTLDGLRVPGVTTLIGEGIPKPKLIGWAAKSVAEFVTYNREAVNDLWDQNRPLDMAKTLAGKPNAIRDSAAKRGREIHTLAERLAVGEEVEVPEEIAPYVAAAAQWMDDWQPRMLLIERPVASRQWWYAGTFDTVIETPDGIRWMVDYKSGQSGIWGEAALQAAAYTHAEFFLDEDGNERPMADLRISKGLGIHLKADGTYEPYEMDVSLSAFEHFNRAAWMARNNKDMKQRLVSGPLPVPNWGGLA